MLFNTLEFAFFLPLVFGVYWTLNHQTRLQNIWIILASYFFYGMWDVRFLGLIILTTVTSYVSGILIGDTRQCKPKAARAWLWTNVTLNLGILFIFKYFNFFAESFTSLLGLIGLEADPVTLKLVLPVGISFYTLQALGYSFDVYRGKIEPCRRVIPFFAFISFFPQLVAGPIERASSLLPQFERARRRFEYATGVDGCRRILWGLFKKVVVADTCAFYVQLIFDEYQHLGSVALLIGAVLFAFQIYGDFSGYSDIAIGSARLFGINLMENFRSPFLSRSTKELWRRWHISLNTWFIDYIYIPLGGSRSGQIKTVVNLMLVFAVSGLWHGADWTYILWGLFFAIMLIAERTLGTISEGGKECAVRYKMPAPRDLLAMTVCFTTFCVGFIFFRSVTAHDAFGYICNMLTRPAQLSPIYGLDALKWCVLVIVVEWLQRGRAHVFDIDNVKPAALRWAIYWAMLWLIHTHSKADIQFIYFQF